MEFVKDGNYYVVQSFMIKDLKLKGNELTIYAIIYGFSQTEGQTFTGSLQYLADWTNSSRQSVINNLKSLCDRGFIEKTEIVKNGVKFCEYKSLPVVKKIDYPSQKSLHNNIDDNIDNIKKEIKKKKEFAPPTLVEVREYAKEKGYAYLANKFYDYFTTGDWVDSKGQKVKNWKQKFITWATYTSKPTFGNQRGYTAKEMDELIQNIDDIEI